MPDGVVKALIVLSVPPETNPLVVYPSELLSETVPPTTSEYSEPSVNEGQLTKTVANDFDAVKEAITFPSLSQTASESPALPETLANAKA